MNRALGIVSAMVWLLAMGLLVHRDVVPFWAAQDPPKPLTGQLAFQIGISNEAGKRIGTSWVTTTPTSSATTVHSATLLDLRVLGPLVPAATPVLLESDVIYREGGRLEQFSVQLMGLGIPVRATAERAGSDFVCKAVVGPMTKTVPLDGRMSESLSDSLRPFTHLGNLYEGQTWRIRTIDPFSVLYGGELTFKTQIARVTKRETIAHGGSERSCFRIETEGAVAWADQTGRVLRQEVKLPMLGRWILTDEPFDQPAKREALARFKSDLKPERGPSSGAAEE